MDVDQLRRLGLRPPDGGLRARVLAAAGAQLRPARCWWRRPGPWIAAGALLAVTVVVAMSATGAVPDPVRPAILPERRPGLPPPAASGLPAPAPTPAVAATDASDLSAYERFDARAMYGVNIIPPSGGTQQREGLDPSEGVEVTAVHPGSAAERSGVRVGDVILAVDGIPVASMTDLRNEVALAGVGAVVEVLIGREGRRLLLPAQLGEWPAGIPYQAIDPQAEAAFRRWQEQRQERIATALQALRRQVEALEAPSAGRPWRITGGLAPE
jgi:membrane-associated protease RseP (regulator of RpoE activity)